MIVVSQGGHPTDVVVQGKNAEATSQFVRGTLAQIRNEMRHIGGAAPVAEGENLAILSQGFLEGFNQLRNRTGGNRIQSGLLSGDKVCNPTIHL